MDKGNAESTSKSASSKGKLANKERAHIAASRRAGRSLQDRLESAQKASDIHHERTGLHLAVSSEAVQKGDDYEEIDPSFERALASQAGRVIEGWSSLDVTVEMGGRATRNNSPPSDPTQHSLPLGHGPRFNYSSVLIGGADAPFRAPTVSPGAGFLVPGSENPFVAEAYGPRNTGTRQQGWSGSFTL